MEIHGDEANFRRALVGAYPSLLRYAEALAGNRAEAWDLVQETTERGLRHRAGFQHGETPNGWLATILRRVFIDRCRRAKTARKLSRRWAKEEMLATRGDAATLALATPGSSIHDTEEDEHDTASERFSSEDVRRALLFIGPHFRIPYALFVFDHLPYGEIGRRLCLAPGTVASRVFRARQRLREILTSGEFRLRTIGSVQVPAEPVALVAAPERRQRPLRARPRGAAHTLTRPNLKATG